LKRHLPEFQRTAPFTAFSQTRVKAIGYSASSINKKQTGGCNWGMLSCDGMHSLFTAYKLPDFFFGVFRR
jgi:hypothetical protein